MRRSRAALIGGLFAVSLSSGTIADERVPSVSRQVGEYHLLAADFHVHSFPFSWATLSSWDTVIEAGYQGLDVIALTPHNHTWVAALGRWFAERFGGPLVIPGEEIAAANYHLIAVGVSQTIPPNLPAVEAIAAVHRQGGAAIAAHPYPNSWPAWEAGALDVLDGAELVRPEAIDGPAFREALQAFARKGTFAPIGSSDHHGPGPIGYTRTYVFARARTAQAVIDAIRNRRTVAFDRDRFYGDPALIEMAWPGGQPAAGQPHPRRILDWPTPGFLRWLSRVTAGVGLLAGILFNRMR